MRIFREGLRPKLTYRVANTFKAWKDGDLKTEKEWKKEKMRPVIGAEEFWLWPNQNCNRLCIYYLREDVEPIPGEYTWTERQDDEIWRHDRFDTIEDCIKDARESGIEPGDKIAIGICQDYVPKVDVDTLLEAASQDAYEECGEVAEHWPSFERKSGYAGEAKLQKEVEKVFNTWMRTENQTPTFYHVIPLKDMYEV